MAGSEWHMTLLRQICGPGMAGRATWTDTNSRELLVLAFWADWPFGLHWSPPPVCLFLFFFFFCLIYVK